MGSAKIVLQRCVMVCACMLLALIAAALQFNTQAAVAAIGKVTRKAYVDGPWLTTGIKCWQGYCMRRTCEQLLAAT